MTTYGTSGNFAIIAMSTTGAGMVSVTGNLTYPGSYNNADSPWELAPSGPGDQVFSHWTMWDITGGTWVELTLTGPVSEVMLSNPAGTGPPLPVRFTYDISDLHHATVILQPLSAPSPTVVFQTYESSWVSSVNSTPVPPSYVEPVILENLLFDSLVVRGVS